MANKEKENKVEQVRVRGRNVHDVLSQVIEKYHSGNGWALKRVVPNLINMDVYLERNSEQGDTVKEDSKEVHNEKIETKESEKAEQQEEVLEPKEEGSKVKPVPKKAATKKILGK